MPQDSPQSGRPLVIATVLTIVLPFLYLASLGPLVGLHSRGVVSEATLDVTFRTVYFPIMYIDESTAFFNDHPIGEAYADYVNWFE